MRAKWNSFRRKFWLRVYLYAGERVGPEVNAYWDQHYWKVVSYRLGQLSKSELGMRTAMTVLGYEREPTTGYTRDQRDGRSVPESRLRNIV